MDGLCTIAIAHAVVNRCIEAQTTNEERSICWFSVQEILQALPVVQWEMSGRGNGPKQIIGWLSERRNHSLAHTRTSGHESSLNHESGIRSVLLLPTCTSNGIARPSLTLTIRGHNNTATHRHQISDLRLFCRYFDWLFDARHVAQTRVIF